MTARDMVLVYLVLGAAWGAFRTPHVIASFRSANPTVDDDPDRGWVLLAAFLAHVVLSLLWPFAAVGWLAFRRRD